MLFAVNNTADGYVVEAYMREENGCGHWYPLRNFGDREGHAKEFANIDCPKLTDIQLRQLAKRYDKSFVYKRVSSVRFLR